MGEKVEEGEMTKLPLMTLSAVDETMFEEVELKELVC